MTNPATRRRVATLNDVAARAGVSAKTVSRALNNEGNVRPDKVARVLAAATELGFKPNEFARLLRTRGMTSMIGVVTADVGDPFWSGVFRGVEAEIAGSDRFILSASVRDRSDHEAEIVSAMVERRVMALLLVPTTDDQSHLAAVTAAGTPVVCLDRPARGADVDAVVADDVGGAERGVRLLLDHGHRRIAFLATPSIYTTGQRLVGYRNALSAAGLPARRAARQCRDSRRRSGRAGGPPDARARRAADRGVLGQRRGVDRCALAVAPAALVAGHRRVQRLRRRRASPIR